MEIDFKGKKEMFWSDAQYHLNFTAKVSKALCLSIRFWDLVINKGLSSIPKNQFTKNVSNFRFLVSWGSSNFGQSSSSPPASVNLLHPGELRVVDHDVAQVACVPLLVCWTSVGHLRKSRSTNLLGRQNKKQEAQIDRSIILIDNCHQGQLTLAGLKWPPESLQLLPSCLWPW